jgi:hypothetical protein
LSQTGLAASRLRRRSKRAAKTRQARREEAVIPSYDKPAASKPEGKQASETLAGELRRRSKPDSRSDKER